jgi:hypothetical protein
MEEWQKVLFGAGVGFFAGLLADPIKASISDKRKARWVETGLISEIKNTNDWISLIIGDLPDKPEYLTTKLYEQLPKTRFEVFEHFYNTERTSFYKIPGFGLYRDFVQEFREELIGKLPRPNRGGACLSSHSVRHVEKDSSNTQALA